MAGAFFLFSRGGRRFLNKNIWVEFFLVVFFGNILPDISMYMYVYVHIYVYSIRIFF